MKSSKKHVLALLCIAFLLLVACQALPENKVTFDAANLQFSGDTALNLEETFITQFPNRDIGMPNAAASAVWLQEQFESYGLQCAVDQWQVINYSKPVTLHNVACRLPGTSDREIVLMAHHDQSPQTVYGADNDGSGIAIQLHLAQLFAAESQPPYSLVFLATDGEEFGMLGSKRFAEQHPDPQRIIAAVSLDNLGKDLFDGLDMSPIGQYNGYGPAWLLQAAQDAASAAADAGDNSIWVPHIRAPFDQVINQAVPISFMDQGPLVAAGIPAFGFAATKPAELEDTHFQSFHTPGDTFDLQSASSLQGAGRATEALVRHLFTMASFPSESAPYIYNPGSRSLLSGPFLWLIFALFVAIFFIASILVGRRSADGLIGGWRAALPHFLALWLPFVLAILSLYLMTALGLLQKFDGYFATQKEPILYSPSWPAVILLLGGLALLLYLGRRLSARLQTKRPGFRSIKSLSLLVLSFAALYAAIFNPFSLLLAVPLLFWLLIGGRRGAAYLLDILLFILGFSLLLYLFYSFGFAVLRIDWYILWYVMMMIAVPMVGFFTMTAVVAIIAAGSAMVVHPPLPAHETAAAPLKTAAAD